MKIFKKFIAGMLALCATLSLVATGCGGEQEKKPPVDPNACTDTVKGHDYAEKDGVCIRCGKKAVIPALPANADFPLVEPCDHGGNCGCEYEGSGEMWNRVELQESCYTIEIPYAKEIWLSFAVEKAGQYVLYSVGGDNDIKAERYNANAHYVPDVGVAAYEENDDFYGYVNCGAGYFNGEWRATYRLSGERGATVKVCFVRVGEPAWEAISVYTKVYATQINGKKAEQPEGMTLSDVPYDSSFFYNEEDGYYHMGTKEQPGALIYAAIDRNASRLFTEAKFTNILQNAGTALNLSNGLTPEGNYSILCYTPFIMNWVDENASWGSRPGVGGAEAAAPEGDPDKNCYQNFCNSDGVYPVTQELFDFLNLYVKANKPADQDVSLDAWLAQEDWIWLSACYYYSNIPVGTESHPLALQEGENEISIPELSNYYCALNEAGSYKLTVSASDVVIELNGEMLTSPIDQTVTVEAGNPVVLRLTTEDFEAATITVTVEKQA